MKILLVTMEYPPMRGGVGNYYFNLSKELVKDDFDVAVLTTSAAANFQFSCLAGRQAIFNLQKNSKFEIKNLLKIVRAPFFYKIMYPKWLKLFFQIKKIIKKTRPDIIWVGQVLPVGETVYLIKNFFKIPYFVSTHGMDIMLPQKKVRKKMAMMKVLKGAEFLTANSRFTKGQLLKLGIDEEKVIVVYPCSHINSKLKTQNLKLEEIRGQLNIKDKKVILTVGRLVPRKGQDMVIKVMPRLLEKFSNLVYLIIGDGPEKSRITYHLSRINLEKNVIILDNVSDDELPAYYELADIFVMPSRDIKGDVEGFGIVYLEANSFGLPVIAGKSGGVIEAVIDRQTGLLVNPEDENDIYEKIVKLLTDEELYKKLSAAGRIRVENEFQWERQAEKIIKQVKLETR